MSTPDETDRPLSVSTGKSIVLKRPTTPGPVAQASPKAKAQATAREGKGAFFNVKTVPDGSRFFEHSEEVRAAAIKRITDPEPETVSPKAKRPPSVKHPNPDLIQWCRGYMLRMKSPRTAMDIVNQWYSTWYGHGDRRPDETRSKHKAAHVDRVSKWLERHERAGRLRVVVRKKPYRGKSQWLAKAYLPVDGADWRRPRKPRHPD